MRIFKHRCFYQWARSEGLSDDILVKTVKEMANGLFEACLGSGLYKKRVVFPGRGKSGGYRTLIAFKKNKRAFFVYGFAKNARVNIGEAEEKIYRRLAKDFLNMDDEVIKLMIDKHKLYEVK